MQIAISYANAGFHDEAKTNLKKAIEADPSRTTPPSLKYLNGESFPVLADIPDQMRQATTLLDDLGTLGLIGLILVIATLLAYRALVPVLEIKDLEGEATDSKAGKGLTALMRHELNELREDGPGTSITYASTNDAKISLPEAITSLSTQVKLLGALLDLLPRRVIRLSGQLLPVSHRGVGLSVLLEDSRGVSPSATFWEEDFDPGFKPASPDRKEHAAAEVPDDKRSKSDGKADQKDGKAKKEGEADTDQHFDAYRRLAVAAAAWLPYQLPLGGKDRTALAAVTAAWSSYARFRVAVTWADDGDKPRARSLYLRSLEADAENVATLVNLGTMDGWDDFEFDRAISRYRVALGRIPGPDKNGCDQNRLWYRAKYDFAASLFHRYKGGTKSARRPLDLAEAMDTARSVIAASCRTLERGEVAASGLRRWIASDDDDLSPALGQFLTKIRAATTVLLADILQTQGTSANTRTEVKTYKDLGHDLGASPPRYPAPQDLIATLTGGIAEDGGPGPNVAGLSPRVRYNLACYYSNRGPQDDHAYDLALEELRSGLDGGDLRSWAQRDPSLANLRDHRKDKFREIVTGAPAAGLDGLHRIVGIAEHAAELARHGIETLARLAELTADPEDRAALAGRIGIEVDLVEQWSELAILGEVVGAEPYLEVLSRAGIRSRRQLVRYQDDPRSLADRLTRVSEANGLSIEISEREVRSWLDAPFAVRTG